MPDINKNFDELIEQYSNVFQKTVHRDETRKGLMKSVPAKVTGVYIVCKKDDHHPIYIGSSGKIHKGLATSGSAIRSRLFNSSTPYHIDGQTNLFLFEPTTSGVPPEGYGKYFPLSDLEVICFDVSSPKAPAALEHLLIQGFINQFGDLPEVNQKI